MPNVLHATHLKYGPVRGLERITVRQKFGNHTLAFLDYKFQSKAEYVMPSGQTPMLANWGKTPLGISTFYGYTNHSETTDDNMTRLVCIGTSQVLNSATPTNWPGYTRSGIAREIAKRNNLRSIVHAHPDVLENWTTGNRSDFAALNALAKEANYRVWVDGSTLYFVDPKKLVLGASTMSIPKFSKDQVRFSRVTGGSLAPREGGPNRRRVIHGLDGTTNEFFTATGGNPDLPTETVPSAVNTYADANRIVEDATDHDYYTLEATLSGNAVVHPGTLIMLEAGRVSRDLGGIWLVSAAEHEIDRHDFTTRVVATRGAEGAPVLSPYTVVSGIRDKTGAVVRDGKRWEAELQEHVNV